jgi:endonuclease/exonuclease/phosphatase family metal-dependent hydrolase
MFNQSLILIPVAMLLASCVGSASAPSTPEATTRKTSELTVLTYNIWHDQRDWPARSAVMFPELSEINPDILGLQEVLQHADLPNQAASIAEELGYQMFFSSVDPPEQEKRYGNAILTRHPIVASSMHKLAPLNDYRTVAHVVIEIEGRLLDIYNTHLHHTGEGGAIRAEQIADLMAFIQRTRQGSQTILMGDFNASPDWPELAPLHTAYTDTFALFVEDPTSEIHATLNHHVGHSKRRIDHLFLERTTSSWITPISSAIVLNEPGPGGVWPSDHFGIVTRFRLNP